MKTFPWLLALTLIVSLCSASCGDDGADAGDDGNNGFVTNNDTNNDQNNAGNNDPNNDQNNDVNNEGNNDVNNDQNNDTNNDQNNDPGTACTDVCGNLGGCGFLNEDFTEQDCLESCEATEEDLRFCLSLATCEQILPVCLPEPECLDYCVDMLTNCPDTYQGDGDGCLMTCAEFAPVGEADDLDGDSLQCRANFALLASEDPAACLSAAPDGGDSCVDGGPCADVPAGFFLANPRCGTAPLTVEFDASGLLGDAEVISVRWDFGADGSTSELAPVVTFNVPGTYTFSFVARTRTEGFIATITVEDQIVQVD